MTAIPVRDCHLMSLLWMAHNKLLWCDSDSIGPTKIRISARQSWLRRHLHFKNISSLLWCLGTILYRIIVEPLFFRGCGISTSDAVFKKKKCSFTKWWQTGTAANLSQSWWNSRIGDWPQYCNWIEFLYSNAETMLKTKIIDTKNMARTKWNLKYLKW